MKGECVCWDMLQGSPRGLDKNDVGTSRAALSCTASKRQPRSIWAFPVSVSTFEWRSVYIIFTSELRFELRSVYKWDLKVVLHTCRADTKRLIILGCNWLKLVCWCLKGGSNFLRLLIFLWYDTDPPPSPGPRSLMGMLAKWRGSARMDSSRWIAHLDHNKAESRGFCFTLIILLWLSVGHLDHMNKAQRLGFFTSWGQLCWC